MKSQLTGLNAKFSLREFCAQSILILWNIMEVTALNNGLALTPPMGFNTWERFRCTVNCELYPDGCINENLIKKTADILSKDYLSAGYKYLVVDDCWLARERDSDKNLVEDKKRFPSGMKSLVRYVQSKGLKFGIYGNLGRWTCAGFPGILDNLQKDVNLFARHWKVDFVKLDGCYSEPDQQHISYPQFGKYLNESGRPIVYSCSWPFYLGVKGMAPNYTAVAENCNLWRNFNDVQDSWQSIVAITNYYASKQDLLARYHGPGHWNDADMLIVGNFGLSYEQAKTQMALWCVLGVPLFISTDLAKIDPKLKEILLNKVAIEINQDPLGRMGRRIYSNRGITIWRKKILPKFLEYHSYGVVVMNSREDGTPKQVVHPGNVLGIYNPFGYMVQDVYTGESCRIPNGGIFRAIVPPTGSIITTGFKLTILSSRLNVCDHNHEFTVNA
ncbi:unnamed protein product [Nesidiocoris tenuis]|uniref:Alpha-galactosidase n=1 Tax=Nesidiocoris tenuis TaxID=355587 RepID=A0A6H5H1T8_9HEMI|nr:unnamed protein product [Nesidiocoris tenuis]